MGTSTATWRVTTPHRDPDFCTLGCLDDPIYEILDKLAALEKPNLLSAVLHHLIKVIYQAVEVTQCYTHYFPFGLSITIRNVKVKHSDDVGVSVVVVADVVAVVTVLVVAVVVVAVVVGDVFCHRRASKRYSHVSIIHE